MSKLNIVSHASLKGLRDENEDKHNIFLNKDGHDKNSNSINYFAVFDGHGGKAVSHYLHRVLYKYFINKKMKYPLTKETSRKVFKYVQDMLIKSHNKEATEAGSTCLMACQFAKSGQEYLNVLNLGDCRMVLCRNNIGMPLTKDHSPMMPEEKTRIEQLGGRIYNDLGVWRIQNLSVSRSFGDLDSSKYVSHIPDLYRYKLSSKDQFFIIACDGLWDVFTCQDAVNFVLHNCYDLKTKKWRNTGSIAKKLGDAAIEKGSSDNITAIIYFF